YREVFPGATSPLSISLTLKQWFVIMNIGTYYKTPGFKYHTAVNAGLITEIFQVYFNLADVRIFKNPHSPPYSFLILLFKNCTERCNFQRISRPGSERRMGS